MVRTGDNLNRGGGAGGGRQVPVRDLLAFGLWFAWSACVYCLIPSESDPCFQKAFVFGHAVFALFCAIGLTAIVAVARRRESRRSGGDCLQIEPQRAERPQVERPQDERLHGESPQVGRLRGGGFRLAVLAGAVLACVGSALVFGASAVAPDVGREGVAWVGESAPALVACMTAGYGAAGLGCAYLCIACGGRLSALTPRDNARTVAIAMVLACALYFGISMLPAAPSGVAVAALPLASAALLHRESLAGRTAEVGAHRISDTPYGKWKITVETSVYWFAFGVMWTVAAVTLLPSGDAFVTHAVTALLATALCCSAMLLSNLPGGNMVLTFWLFAPLFIIGIAVVAVFGEASAPFFFAMFFAPRLSMGMQLISHFAAVCRADGYPPTLLFGRSFAAFSVAEATGIAVGAACALLTPDWLTIALLFLLAFVICSLIVFIVHVNAGFRSKEVARATEEVRAQVAGGQVDRDRDTRDRDAREQTVPPEAPAALSAEAQARSLARTYSFSARETEVAALLLAGRTAPLISEKLGISQTTVNTHVRHIYEKASVRTRQELIDLAELERAPR